MLQESPPPTFNSKEDANIHHYKRNASSSVSSLSTTSDYHSLHVESLQSLGSLETESDTSSYLDFHRESLKDVSRTYIKDILNEKSEPSKHVKDSSCFENKVVNEFINCSWKNNEHQKDSEQVILESRINSTISLSF